MFIMKMNLFAGAILQCWRQHQELSAYIHVLIIVLNVIYMFYQKKTRLSTMLHCWRCVIKNYSLSSAILIVIEGCKTAFNCFSTSLLLENRWKAWNWMSSLMVHCFIQCVIKIILSLKLTLNYYENRSIKKF